MCCIKIVILLLLGGSVVQWLGRWTRDGQIVGSIPGRCIVRQ